MEREPDLSLGGFSLWVTGQPYADSDEPYAQNILNIEVAIETPRSAARAATVLSAASLSGFSRDLDKALVTLSGEAVLLADESENSFTLNLAMKPLGHVSAVVDLRLGIDDAEDHRISWGLDQSYLDPFARQVRGLAMAYPSPFTACAPDTKTAVAAVPPNRLSRLMDLIFGERNDRA